MTLDNQQGRPGTTSADMEQAAKSFDLIAVELEEAAKHARIAAVHVRRGEVPRYAAHAFAVIGHLENVKSPLGNAAKVHASKASTDVE